MKNPNIFRQLFKGLTKKETKTQKSINHWKKLAFKAGAKGELLEPIITAFKNDNNQNLHAELASHEGRLSDNQAKQNQSKENLKYLSANKSEAEERYQAEYIKDHQKKLSNCRNTAKAKDRAINKSMDRYLDIDTFLKELPFETKESRLVLTLLSVIGICAYLGCETPILWSFLEKLLYTEPFVAIIAALILSGLGALCAHIGGKYLYKKHFIIATFSLVFGLGINVISVGIRYFTEGNMTRELILTGLLIFIVFGINVLIAYLITKGAEPRKIAQEHAAVEKKIEKDTQEKQEIEAEVKEIEEGVIPYAEERYNKDILRNQKIIKSCLSEEIRISKEIETIEIKYKDTEATSVAEITNTYNNGQYKVGKNFGFNASCIVVLLATSLFLTSCAETTGVITELNLGADATASISLEGVNRIIDENETYDFIMRELDLDTINFENDGAIVRFTHLGWASVPTIQTVTLPARPGHWLFNNRLDRQKEIKTFKIDLKNAIRGAAQVKPDQMTTQIYRPTINLLEQLSSQSTTKQIVLMSDFISDNDLINLSISKYMKNPSLIIEQDFEKLSGILLQDNAFPKKNLENLEIILIHRENEKNSTLATHCARFFKKFFEAQGITVKERAQL